MHFNIFTGGKKDEYRPYPGYKLSHGSKTISQCFTDGHIPLIISARKSYFAYGEIKAAITVTSTVGGTKTFQFNKHNSTNDSYSHILNADVDLEKLFDYDLSAIESIISITNNSYWKETDYPVTKWLEPIGGGS